MLSALAISLAATSLLGIPLALLARQQVYSAERSRLHEQAAAIAVAVEDRLDAGQQIDLTRNANLSPERVITISAPDGRVAATAGSAPRGSLLTQSTVVNGYSISVSGSAHPTAVRATQATLLVAAIGVVAVAASMGVALWQARRITRPVARLVADAHALGRAEPRPPRAPSGVSELDDIAAALETSTVRLERLIAVQREFASDAAHQLRTPLTGIGLRLDELARIGDPDVVAEANDALVQVERLDGVITALLDRARDDSAPAVVVDVGALIDQESILWRRVLSRQQRGLSVVTAPGQLVLGRREHLRAIANALIENAIVHGGEQVYVNLEAQSTCVVLTVSDDGDGIPSELGATVFDRHVTGGHGTGIGLSLARSLAMSEGGQLELTDRSGATFVLSLPAFNRHARPLDGGTR